MHIFLKLMVTYYPKALYQILDKGLRAKVSMKKFKINDKSFDFGTIMVPVKIKI